MLFTYKGTELTNELRICSCRIHIMFSMIYIYSLLLEIIGTEECIELHKWKILCMLYFPHARDGRARTARVLIEASWARASASVEHTLNLHGGIGAVCA